LKFSSAERTNCGGNLGDNPNFTFLPPSTESNENHSSLDSALIDISLAKIPKEKLKTNAIGATDTSTNPSVLERPKNLNGTRMSPFHPKRSSARNAVVGHDNLISSPQSRTVVNGMSKSYQDQTMRPIYEETTTTNESAYPNPTIPIHRPKTNLPRRDTEHNSAVEESNYGTRSYGENDDGENGQNSPSDDLSEILLSQSQRLPQNTRRVTASPKIFPNKSTQVREQFRHYSKAFSIQDQNRYQNANYIDFNRSKEKQNILGVDTFRTQQHLSFSKKSWMSRGSKRSPSFKQTSIISSTNRWVSNQRARNFVKSKSSPKVPLVVLATAKATSSGSHAKENTTNKSGNCFIRKDITSATVRTSTKSFGRDNNFVHTKGDEGTSSEIVGVEVRKENLMRKISTTEIVPSNISELEKKTRASTSVSRHWGTKPMNDFFNDSDDASKKVVDKAGRHSQNQDIFKYEEVVRGKMAREALNGYECEECAAFFDKAVLHGDGAKCYDRDELLRCSRHRGRHTPPSTPQDYWELSFIDEREARLHKEAEGN